MNGSATAGSWFASGAKIRNTRLKALEPHLMATVHVGMPAAAYSQIHPEERCCLAFLTVAHPLATYIRYAPATYHPCSAS